LKITRTLFITLGSIFLLSNLLFAQKINNTDKIYDNNIVTVLLHAKGDQLSPAVMELNSDEKLELSFDDLSNKYYPFKYTFIHCTSDWKTSDLNPMDYIDGYFEGDINNYKFSFNTLTPYIHYHLIFPSDEMRPKLSGNYILKVYIDDGSGPQMMFTRRFFVVESKVKTVAQVALQPKDLNFIYKKQQIDLQIHTSNTFSDDPEQRFTVNIRQNGRWDNALMNLHPSSVTPNELYFDYPNGILFDGGNEPRFFDLKSFRYLSQSVQKITPENNYYKVILHTDYPRNKNSYETYQNIHGKKLITARNDQDPMLEGDYAKVNFSLKTAAFDNASVYIIGALTDWILKPEGKMIYQPARQQYEGQILLKQGYYEYWYVVVPAGSHKGDITQIEGDHWETRNDYTIYVYYHERTPEYDRLVDVHQISALESQ